MPDYFSHSIAAEIIYERLDTKNRNAINSKTLYLLGAQGGDIFFAYNIKPTKSNLGRSLHRENPAELFGKLKDGNLSYAAGFATHYALDCTLHPDIFAYESSTRSPFAHVSFENDLGLYISRKFAIGRHILPREHVLACTGAIYDSIKKVEPRVTVTGVERCLKRHFLYTRWIFRTKRMHYKCAFDFNSLSDKVDEAVGFGIRAVECILGGNTDGEIFNKSFLQH